jgi:hypothetical protein
MLNPEYPSVFLALILVPPNAFFDYVCREKFVYFFLLDNPNRYSITKQGYLWKDENELCTVNISVYETILSSFLRLAKLHRLTTIIQSAGSHKHDPLERMFYHS